MRRIIGCLALALTALALAGCGSARYGEPITGDIPVSQAGLASGKMLFQEHCHQCHPSGESGIGPALNNKPLPRSLIHLQVRQGLGEMPAFPEERIADGELENLIGYVKALAAVAGSSQAAEG